MSLQIKSIVLYSFDGEVRVLNFKLGSVNIITGRSRTGKTAIGDIIDYCLGKSTYNIPESDQFNAVSWFGVMFAIRNNDIFIAKPRPKIGVETQSNGYIAQGSGLEIPSHNELTLNANDDEIVETLTYLIGIKPNVNVTDEGQSRDPLKANVKHTKYYLFQNQNLITDKEVLFYRQKESFMPQAIKDTMPYFFGAVPENYLLLINDLRKARQKFSHAKRDFEEAESILSNRLMRGQGLYKEAQDVILIESGDIPTQPAEILAGLRSTQGWQPDKIIVNPNDSSVDLNDEIQKHVEASREIDRKIKRAKTHQETFSGFASEAHEQSMRLQSIELITNSEGNNEICPVCNEPMEIPPPDAKTISDALDSMKNNLDQVETEQPHLNSFIEEQEEEKTKIQQEIDHLLVQLQAVYDEEENRRHLRDQNAVIAKVVGRISLYLDTIHLVDDLGLLRDRFEAAKKEVELAKELLDELDKDEALQSILNKISQMITQYAEDLNLEHVEYHYRFSYKSLTVLADRPGAPIPMRRIGSAENWLGIHIATLLSFHKFFVENERPIPRFLVLDQPSQVYFASEDDYATYKQMEGRVEDMAVADHDAAKVSKLFNLLFRFCEELDNNFQIIVTEHANLDQEEFRNALIEAPWTDGRALIPNHWEPPKTKD